VIVVDASVLAVALADDDADGDRVRVRLRGQRLSAPELIDLEVLSVFRRMHASGHLDRRRADLAVTDLIATPIDRAPHHSLIPRCWELRDSMTPYDAAYVALAEAFDATLVTADRRLPRSSGPRCRMELLVSETSDGD
jgi:predicted nucleic acid-binding protein